MALTYTTIMSAGKTAATSTAIEVAEGKAVTLVIDTPSNDAGVRDIPSKAKFEVRTARPAPYTGDGATVKVMDKTSGLTARIEGPTRVLVVRPDLTTIAGCPDVQMYVIGDDGGAPLG